MVTSNDNRYRCQKHTSYRIHRHGGHCCHYNHRHGGYYCYYSWLLLLIPLFVSFFYFLHSFHFIRAIQIRHHFPFGFFRCGMTPPPFSSLPPLDFVVPPSLSLSLSLFIIIFSLSLPSHLISFISFFFYPLASALP